MTEKISQMCKGFNAQMLQTFCGVSKEEAKTLEKQYKQERYEILKRRGVDFMSVASEEVQSLLHECGYKLYAIMGDCNEIWKNDTAYVEVDPAYSSVKKAILPVRLDINKSLIQNKIVWRTSYGANLTNKEDIEAYTRWTGKVLRLSPDKNDYHEDVISYLRSIPFKNDGDTETEHIDADETLCNLLTSLGYGDVVKEYDKIDKWYS